MENPYSVLANEEEGAQKDVVDFFKFSSLVPDVKVELSDSNFHSEKYKKFPSLLACSSKYGFFVTGSRTGFQLGQTKLLRETIYKAEKGAAVSFDHAISVTVKEGDVDILALTSDDLQLIVGVSGGVLLTYNISDIVKNKEETIPVQTQTLDADITFIQPNPEVYRDVIAIITQKNECKLIRYMTSEIITTISNVSSLCWSRLGKQFVCGTLNGLIEAYDINGNKKDVIDPPPSQNGMLVNAVVWVDNHVFLAIYADGQQSHTPYIIKRKMEDPDEKYTLLDEVNPIYNIECPDSHFYFTIIRNFGKEIKTLITLANTAAGDLAIVGESEDGSWATWIMGETSISLPLSDDDVLDTYPVGLAVDFSASEPLEPFDSAENETPVPPMPVVMFMTNEGRVCAYHAYNFDLAKAGTKYENMVEAQDLNTIPEPVDVSEVPEATATVAAVTGGGFGGFGEAPTKIPAFNSLGSAPKPTSSNSSTPATASPTFGSTSNVGFGTSGFGGAGAEQKVSFASLAKSSTPAPASPGVSAFGFNATSSTPAFGQPSGFGTKPDDDSKPVFGSTSAVGQAPVSAFGQTSAIGQAAAPAFGRMSSFGNVAPAFGQTSSMGQSTTPAFGQTSSFGSFGSFGSNKQIDSPFKAKPFGTSDSTSEATPIDPKNPFGATSFAPASIDVDTLVKKANEEPVTKLTEEPTQDTAGAKSMFGLPNTSKKQDSNDSCTFSFESVKKDLGIEDGSDTESEISKVSSIDKSKDAFGFSVSPNDYEDTEPVKKYSTGEPIGVTETTDSDYLQDSDDEEDESDEDDDVVVVEEEELEKSTEKLGKRTTRKRYDQHVQDSDDFEDSEIHTDKNDENCDTDDKKDIEKENSSALDSKPSEKKENVDEKTSKSSDKEAKDKKDISKDEKDMETEESKREREIAEEKSKEQEEKKREEERIAEAKRHEEEEKRREEARIAEEERREQEKIAEKKRLEEERIAEEKRLEEEKIAEEKRREEERIAEAKRLEEERIAEEKRSEEERIAEEKRREEARIAEEKRLEEERIAEEKRRKEEARRREEARLAALRQPPVMASRERTSRPTVHERAAGIKGIAKDFESVYFETIEDLESTSMLINDIKQDISIQLKTDFSSKHVTQLMDYGFEWKMDDMYDIENMRKYLNDAADRAEDDLLELYNSVTTLLDSTNSLKLEDLRSCLETKEDMDTIKSALEVDSINQISSLETKLSSCENTIKELSDKLNVLKQQTNPHKSKSVDESKLTMYTLRRTIRDIEKSISEQSKKISILEQEELSSRLNISQNLSSPIATVYNQNKSGSAPFNQRKLFFDQMFQQCKPLNV